MFSREEKKWERWIKVKEIENAKEGNKNIFLSILFDKKERERERERKLVYFEITSYP